MRRVLVTGATGFIGRHSLPLLVSRGYDVHAVTARQPMSVEPGSRGTMQICWRRTRRMRCCSTVRPTGLLHFAWSRRSERIGRSCREPSLGRSDAGARSSVRAPRRRQGGGRRFARGGLVDARRIAPKTSLRSNRGRFTERPRTPRDRDAQAGRSRESAVARMGTHLLCSRSARAAPPAGPLDCIVAAEGGSRAMHPRRADA